MRAKPVIYAHTQDANANLQYMINTFRNNKRQVLTKPEQFCVTLSSNKFENKLRLKQTKNV